MSEGRVTWHHVGNRIMGNPFQPTADRAIGGNPFATLAEEWCNRCKMAVDTDTEAHHRAGVYVYKRTCRRCGRVLKYGAYKAPLVSDQPLRQAAVEFLSTPGQDRR